MRSKRDISQERYSIPSTIKIGPYKYTVSFVSFESASLDNLGTHNRVPSEIVIQEKLPRSVTLVIFFREVLLCINPHQSKSVVEALANSLVSFLLDNNFPKKKIPQTVKIGPSLYTVILCNSAELPNDCGEINRGTLTIKIREDMQPTVIWGIFIHECLHAMNHGLKESMVELLSTLLFITLDDVGFLRVKN